MTWNDVRTEINARQPKGGSSKYDLVRREKVVDVEKISGIPLVIYATDFTDEGRAAQYAQYGAGIQIDLGDKTGFSQALSDIPDGPLDVLIHSPGGSPSAAESIVRFLRSRFDPIRFIVPHTAKSAATMLALAGDEILLGEAGELGPIDPQLRILHDQRVITVPAGAAIDLFNGIRQEITKNPTSMGGWLPIIRQYGPSFLQECYNAVALSEELVAEWLQRYMFKGEGNAETRAKRVAAWLAQHGNFKSHSRPVWIDQIQEIDPGIKVHSLRTIGAEFEAAIMSVYWAIDLTFGGTGAFKIIEHTSSSAAYIRVSQVIQGLGEVALGQPINRQQRRQQDRKDRKDRKDKRS